MRPLEMLEETMQRMAGWALALALVVTASVARAEPSVAVLGVEAVDAPGEMAGRVGASLKSVVRNAAGYRLVGGKDLDEIKLVFGCVDEKPDCMARAGVSMQVNKLLWGTLRKAAGGYNLTIKLLDVANARVEKFVSENVAALKMSGAGARAVVERLSRGLFVGARSSLKVTCNVNGAAVTIGTTMAGITAESGLLVRDLPPGTVTVQVKKEGYRTWTQQITVQGGETALVDVTLEEAGGRVVLPATQPATQPTTDEGPGPGWKVAFWSGAAATVGLAVGAIVTGKKVWDERDNKEALVLGYSQHVPSGAPANWFVGGDVCENDKLQNPEHRIVGLQAACDNGSKYAIITNVLWGVAGGMAIISGVLYWKAYIAKDSSAKEKPPASKPAEAKSTVRWLVTPSASPHGGGVGLKLTF
jgi:hypothetical protein